MLKVTYTENGLHLEHLKETIEDWITLRVIFALRTGQRLILEANTASVLFPVHSFDESALEVAILHEDSGIVAMSICDADYIEVSIQGTWVTFHSEEEGIFIAQLHPQTEHVLLHLWQAAHCPTFPLRR